MNCPSTNRRTVELGGRGVASQLRYQRDHQIDDIYLVLPGPFWVSNTNDTFYNSTNHWKTSLRFLAGRHCWWNCKVSAHWKTCRCGQGSNIQWWAKNWFASQHDKHEKTSNTNRNNSSNMFVVLNSVFFAIKMAGGFDKLNPSLLETTVQCIIKEFWVFSDEWNMQNDNIVPAFSESNRF